MKQSISSFIFETIRCPTCRSKVHITDKIIQCLEASCGLSYPVIEGIPILINSNSLFTTDDFINHKNTYFKPLKSRPLDKLLDFILPDISANPVADKNLTALSALLFQQAPHPNVLIVGGSIPGQGFNTLSKTTSLNLIETDISFGPRTQIISDAHDIPFADCSFDGIILQAVLEHVTDPHRCVSEAWRVLKDNGYIYAEVPFMQQIHGGRYDFTRFTHLGLRQLFRNFYENASGAVCGPGMALAWAYKYFLLSFSSNSKIRRILSDFSRITSFFLKYFDYYLISKPPSLDSASGFFFMGRKSASALTDKQIIDTYQGCF